MESIGSRPGEETVVLGIGSRSWGKAKGVEENRKNIGIREERRERGDNCTGQYFENFASASIGIHVMNFTPAVKILLNLDIALPFC